MTSSRLTPLILAVALFMENIDSTVIATSLAAIARDVGSEPIALKLALTSYLVALAIFIPVSSYLADTLGAKTVFRWAMVVFMVGSVACAVSDSLVMFVGARFIQGMGGAMMSPIARLVLVRVTPRDRLVDALAWLSIPALIGPIAGPPIGGFITTYFSWHWIFLINVPIGLIGIVAVSLFLPDWERNQPRRMDFLGFVLAGLAFAGWVFGISVLTLPALPPEFGYAALVVGTAAGLLYLRHEKHTAEPLLDLRLFRFPLFRMTVLAGGVFRLGTGAMGFLFPLALQLSFGFTPFQSGMITFALAIGQFAAKFVAERVLKWQGFRGALVTATALTAAGLVGMGLYTPETPLPLIVVALIITGFFQSIFWTATNAFTFADISDKDAGQANVISQVFVQITLAFGVAIGGGVLDGVRLGTGGGEPDLFDFHVAFYVLAGVTLVSSLLFLRIPKGAGLELTRSAKATGAGPDRLPAE